MGDIEDIALFDLAPLAMWLHDARTQEILKVNQAALATYGYERSEFLKLRYTDLIAPEARTPTLLVNGLQRHLRNNGRVIEVSVELLPIADQNADVILVGVRENAEFNRVTRAHAQAVHSLAETLESIAEGFFAMDSQFRITAINQRGAEILGRSRDELINQALLEQFPGVRDTTLPARYEAVIRDQVSDHFETYYPEHDRWYVIHAFPFDTGVAVYFHDITEARRAAEGLRRSHEQFELAVEATNDVIWDWHIADNDTWWGPALTRLLGYERVGGHASAQLWSECLHPDDRDQTIASVTAALRSDAVTWTAEYRFKRSDGSYADILDRAMIVRHEGNAQRMVGAMQDVTHARSSERELQGYERLVNTAPTGIILVDARDRKMPIVFVNPAFEAITGYAQDDVLGSNCRFLQGPEHEQEALDVLRAAIAAGRQENVVLRNYRKDGTLFWNYLIITPVLDAVGKLHQYLGIMTDVTAQRRSEDALAYQATHDSLTGLPNRQLVEDRLSQALIQAARHSSLVAVFSIALDDFKAINDGIGFGAGDEMLQHVAKRLAQAVGPGDSVARLIADEYVAICTGLDSEAKVKVMAQKLLKEIGSPMRLGSREVHAQASVGIAIAVSGQGHAEELLRKASAAMLEAKVTARGSFRFHHTDMDYRIADRLALATRLREALEHGDFVLHYQLQTSTLTGRLHGAEALLRWRKPDGELAYPHEFIAVAESTGLIVPIGHWVLTEALRQAKAWRDEGLPELTMSVNVSVAQFRRAGFVDEVREVLEKSGVPASCLELEITETLAMDGVEAFIETLERLKQLGLRIALDDFGTGFSSLTYLRRFAVNTLKIDRSFVRDITTDAKDAAICRTIIAMARNLGMASIAEGVETAAQASYLARNGCDRLQGYLLHRPVSPKEVASRIRSGEPFFVPGDIEDDRARILVVDDDDLVAEALQHILERNGYRCVIRHNVAHAFETLALEHFDVVIADERMPDQRGSDFLSAVKDLYPSCVRILQSGFPDADVIAGALNQAQIFRYIGKGASESQILACVRAAFESIGKIA